MLGRLRTLWAVLMAGEFVVVTDQSCHAKVYANDINDFFGTVDRQVEIMYQRHVEMMEEE